MSASHFHLLYLSGGMLVLIFTDFFTCREKRNMQGISAKEALCKDIILFNIAMEEEAFHKDVIFWDFCLFLCR